ncbi:parvalbumin, thymic CPV3-like [Protopterus annectens]|uniref:parvalbumin, thymic CPV3-like n=1 Tax=Protopterus annectens TaxID=7888 RepID=UPI001CFAF746|nr:parvalbumin, thymic CPV3-like [Protopterus annectens]
MSLCSILTSADITAAVNECKAPDSFDFRKFFKTCGLKQKTESQIREAFHVLDNDKSGFIEVEELQNFLQLFSSGARLLTAAETKTFISAADHDGDGKIGEDEFVELVLHY